jgi:hypothetical protein
MLSKFFLIKGELIILLINKKLVMEALNSIKIAISKYPEFEQTYVLKTANFIINRAIEKVNDLPEIKKENSFAN